MKCISRSTFGIIIAIRDILCCFILLIFATVAVIGEDTNGTITAVFTLVLIFCFIVIPISGLLIWGIVKKRHKLMQPWLVLSAFGAMLFSIQYPLVILRFLIMRAPVSIVLTICFVGALIIGILGLTLYPVFTLYRDICKQNMEQSERIINLARME